MTLLLALLLGPLLWLAGAILFDGVHCALHGMLRSRFPLLRALARPHGVHHEWIDRELETHWELRSANIWCHIVPEYGTQLAFTAVIAATLPLPFAAVLGTLQTVVFLGILKDRGRDVNHRPAARIDAHPPGWTTPPAYHALHHAWPDAYFSAYTKLVDWIVGGGSQIAGRRFAWRVPVAPVVAALRHEVERAGGIRANETEGPDDVDVLVLTTPESVLAPAVEAFIERTRDRQLAPEVWALRSDVEDPTSRYYRSDPRVCFRVLLSARDGDDEAPVSEASQAARRALFWIRRDAHLVGLGRPLAAR